MQDNEHCWKQPEELDTSDKRVIWAKVIREKRTKQIKEQQKLFSVQRAKSKKIHFLREKSPGYQEITPKQVEAIFPYMTK
jgi:hypothetical protein